MALENWIIALIVFMVGIVILVPMINDANDTYGLNLSDELYNESFMKLNETYNITQEQKTSLFGKKLDEADTADSMFLGGFTTIRNVRKYFSLFGNIVNSAARTLGMPQELIKAALAVLTISIIFSTIYLIFRVK